jgi:outer membrane protein OmpA-like peptidoglycan-associated protein/flagellar hook assembly protein FlgD
MGLKRHVRLFLLLALVLAFGYGCVQKTATEIELPEGKTAKIVFIVGDVFFRPVSDSEWIRATVGDIITEGTSIRTFQDSYCELVVGSGTIFRMKDRSELRLAALPQDQRNNRTLMHLLGGDLFTRAEKVAYRSRDTIRTDTATLNVKGTGFLVSSRPGSTEVLVSDGTVNVHMNVNGPDIGDLPPELRRIMRRVARGINVREGNKVLVTAERVEGIEETVRRILRRGSSEALELEQLKQEAQLRTQPLEKRERELVKELNVLSLNFVLGYVHYLSPNFDGVSDEFRFDTRDFRSEKLHGWRMVFKDGDSRIQRVIRSRYVEEDEAAMLPDVIVWNLVNKNGDIVPDGEYAYEFYTSTKNSHETLRIRGVIVVDTVPPQLEISVEDLMFSPNEDGVKDTVVMGIDAEERIAWTATITTLNEINVKTIEWGEDIPDVFEWDGKGENGTVLPEGIYTIMIVGIDRAGNRTREQVEGITLDVRERQATVDVDTPVFSPNGDGLLDTMTFFPILSDRFRIDTWDLIVQLEKGETARRFRGRRYMPPFILWDGKPQAGLMSEIFTEGLPSGYYTYFLKVAYTSGVNTYSFKRDLILDVDPPEIELDVEPEIFSPDGDGLDDTLFIKPEVSDLTDILGWKAKIYTTDDRVFKTFVGTDVPAESISWDGFSDRGVLVDSAEDYYVMFEVTDQGFNTGLSEKVPFSIDILIESTDRGLKIRVSNVEFGFNTAELQGDKTYRILDKIIAILQKYQKYSILVEGHTDSTGDETYNIELSESRAEAVGTYLVDNGIDSNRLEYVGYGPKYPIDTNATVEGRRRNRRVEFLLIHK